MARGRLQPVRVSRGELDAMIRHAFGANARIDREIPLGGGQINDTRMVTLAEGQHYVLRVAPSAATAASGPGWFTPHGLRREQAVIAAAADLAPQLPVTVAHDFDGAVIERDWVFQVVMLGRPLQEIDSLLSPNARVAIWEQVGEFTRHLHAIRGDHFGPPAGGPVFERWSELLAWDGAGLVRDAERFALDIRPFQGLRRAIEALTGVLDEVTTPSLVHSDLSPSHIFAAKDELGNLAVSGFIDLEFGRFADPLSESLFSWFERDGAAPAQRAACLAGYGRPGFTASERLRMKLHVALSLGWWATLLAYRRRPHVEAMEQMVRALEELGSLIRSSGDH